MTELQIIWLLAVGIFLVWTLAMYHVGKNRGYREFHDRLHGPMQTGARVPPRPFNREGGGPQK